jgi:hypothetical protein
MWNMVYIHQVCAQDHSVLDWNIDIERRFSIYPVVADNIRLS